MDYVCRAFEAPIFLLAAPNGRWRSLKEVVEFARSHPGQLNYATVGPASLPHMMSRRDWTAWQADGRLRVLVGPDYAGATDAFQIHAPRRTTEELLGDLLRVMSPVAPYRAELGSFLELCDLAKYARWSLSRAEMANLVDSAERFVRATAAPQKGTS